MTCCPVHGQACMTDLVDSIVGSAPPSAGLVPRGDQLQQREDAFRAVHGFERDRRRMAFVTGFGGWILSAFLAVLLALAILLVLHRPVPHDRLLVTVLHDDGTYTPPQPIEQAGETEQELAVRNVMFNYVVARESYTWEAIQHDYDVVSALSAPAEQARYQGFILGKDPERPTAKYGKAGDVAVSNVHIFRVAPNAMEAHFVRTVRQEHGDAVTKERMIARITYVPSDAIPATVLQQYDPAGILITKYDAAKDGPQ
jgi:type IV secretory pathway component VirB8